ncbi:leucine dehydrogenase [Reichenbachiella sp. 5M10]|uniref:Glu/Leu/Phe/Val dehydrogenase dimerization domain-containing protein n=1 Tax=Reichenbachiella sp. 5M10 TaxID=1889772 RepID=UPI000C14C453|nr:Glu/Leu/Phe/Val dehydrogenase dimerization domain-containing protein [Reichenbachiella sp. 5M10]PIB33959.1 leucine dehydrogenase [Reichenbachiella sp. 5M10]
MIELTETMNNEAVSIFSDIESMNHEQVVLCHDKETGLKAIIAIHNTVLGPSMGGTRMWHYATDQEAMTDALRLSRGMTLKNSIAGLNIGGGKAVIIGEASQLKNEALMRRFGKFVHSLGGKYYTAEDVNMTTRDMEYIRMETPYVTGLPDYMGGAGDPSPYTAYGVFVGMKAAAKRAYGSESLSGKKVLVQGTGNVGTHLIDYLTKDGAKVSVSDIFEDKIKRITDRFSVEVVAADQVATAPVDIYAPCALGGTINDDSLGLLSCDIVAGAANNQLLDETVHGQKLLDKGILYAPDFLINGGGITNVYYEYAGNHSHDRVMAQTEKIYDTTLSVFDMSQKTNTTPHQAAIKIAEDRIKSIGNIKLPL